MRKRRSKVEFTIKYLFASSFFYMANNKSTFVRRSSLCLPHDRNDAPNASLVDSSHVHKTPMQHPRQCDQDIESDQEHEKHLAQQRLSLINAVKVVEHWHQRDSVSNSKKEIHQFYTAPQNTTNQTKKFFFD